jgi:signal transduction histidine kinase/ligand-binding sensor domain-containing protein
VLLKSEAVNSRRFRNIFCWARIAFFALIVPSTLFAQRSSNWRIYRASDGLQDSVCIGISEGGRSGIWIHHPDRSVLSWLDGYEVRKVPLPGLTATHIYEGRSGQIWAPVPGGIAEFVNGAWVRYPISGVTNKINAPLLPLRQGQVLVLAPDRLISFTSDPPTPITVREATATKLGAFTDMIRSRDGGAWICGQHGIGKFSSLRPIDATSSFDEHLPPTDMDVENLSAIAEDNDGGITCIARSKKDGKKIALHWDQHDWIALPASANITQAWCGHDGSFWELAPDSLHHLHKIGSEWRTEDELIAAQYYDAAIEPNGAFAVATSEGLYRYTPLIWQPAGPSGAGPMTIAAGTQQRLWCVSATDLNAFDGEKWTSTALPESLRETSLPNPLLVELANQSLLIGGSNQLFTFDTKARRFTGLKHPSGKRLSFVGTLKDGVVCFQVQRSSEETRPQLETFDGTQFKPLVTVSTNAATGSDVRFVFTTANGVLWVCGDKSLAFYADGKWQNSDVGAGSEELVGMIEAGQNKIWAAARDRIFQYNGKDWTVLQGGFDRINGMSKGRDGSIWVASNSGVHRAYKNDWVANGSEEGLSGLVVRNVVEDSQGHVWAATARGLDLYHPEADTDAPKATIQPLSTESIPMDGNVTLDFDARDRWKQTFPDRLLYSYRLDEQEWSPMHSERSMHFTELAGGKHFFQVRAMDRNWNVDAQPTLLEFFVPVPWYRETRLVLIAGAAGFAVLFFAGLAFNRHRQLVRSYAEVEQIIDQRTRELEKANRELLQSQKMNALGTLAAGIAHDFNSILSIIKGSAQIIETNVENPEKIRTRVDRINTAVDQGAGIVKAMLGFSRSSDHQVSQCDLNGVIRETIQILGDRFQRDAEVKFEPAANLENVCVVKDFVQQIVLNFILNAAEASSQPAKIVVRTGTLDQMTSDFALAPEPAARYAYVSVQDFGTGIAPEILPRIFEPFFTTKSLSTKRGTGLGLSMAYELAKEMKSGLSVRSKVGEGSTFMLVVPITI